MNFHFPLQKIDMWHFKNGLEFILFFICSNCLCYLDMHSILGHIDRFIPVVLPEPFPSLMKPNMLIHILRMRPHSSLYNGLLQPSHLIGH